VTYQSLMPDSQVAAAVPEYFCRRFLVLLLGRLEWQKMQPMLAG
jgi:hypothetical protein